MWGIVFALLYDVAAGRLSWLKGLIFGMPGRAIFSNWIFLPLIRQYVFSYPPQPLFCGLRADGDAHVLLILGGFGLGLGIIYGLIARDRVA